MAVREAPPPKAKRFYKSVSVAEQGGVFAILLDGRPVKTPLKKALETRHRALADAIAAEWRAQGAEIDPAAMPLTRLLSTAIDRVAAERDAMTASLLAYLDTDLLCYRAPHPAALKERQAAVWQPILDWLEAAHGIGLSVVHGVAPVTQPEAARAAAARVLSALPVDTFTAVQAAAAATGSVGLALALGQGRISAAEAFAAAQLDETYQNEQWGEDAEALERRRRIEADIAAVGRYLALITPS
jgi:chaperone required for assembly of F1-ATPase